MIRLYIKESLLSGALITLEESRAHYLRHVMRLDDGDALSVFNANEGEWNATVCLSGKRVVQLRIQEQMAAPRTCPDIWLAFATLKNKNELVVEKATELGVREIHPIITQHSVVKTINVEKLLANAVEAAEQCERHDVPAIIPHKNLASFLSDFPKDRVLLYGDESGFSPPLLREKLGEGCCILIGPEGGFSADEHRMLQSASFAVGLGMGPRILRADTAAIAALACVQSHCGDWAMRPHFRSVT